MPSHSHQYEKFCHKDTISFDTPNGTYRKYPNNKNSDNDSGRFLYTYSTKMLEEDAPIIICLLF